MPAPTPANFFSAPRSSGTLKLLQVSPCGSKATVDAVNTRHQGSPSRTDNLADVKEL